MIFRAAEAYLNYIEADYVKNGNLDANSQKYWKALRQRAGVDTDYQKTIAATDLSKEDDLAKYSGATMVDQLSIISVVNVAANLSLKVCVKTTYTAGVPLI